MTAHPMTARARLLAEEFDGGWLILSLCDALDGEYEHVYGMRAQLKMATEQIERMAGMLVEAGAMPGPVPTDPRERALYLRKHRNTGPGKPIQEQRRRR